MEKIYAMGLLIHLKVNQLNFCGSDKMRIIIFCWAIFAAFIMSSARANDLYNSFVESVDQANSQAHISLADGVYISAAGDSTMVWNLSGGNRATIAFKYANRTLQSGSIVFFEPLKVEIRAASGLCSVFKVKKLSFDVGGALDPDNSDFILAPPTPGFCNYSRNALLLEQHLAISNDSGRFFHGRVFSASDGFKKCKDSKCKQTTVGQPVTKVVFFSKLQPDGTLDAISVLLRRNATLRLPNSGGWIQVGDGTQAKVAQLTYDLVSETGSAFINDITINVRSGSISTGDNVINLESGTQVVFSSIDIEQKPGVTSIKDGDILGTLGSQSVLILTAGGSGKKSAVIFNKGEVALKHVGLSFGSGKSTFKAQYAQIKGDVRDAVVYFSERNSLSINSFVFQVDLRCSVASDDCYGVEWQSSGQVKATGTISPFEASINGGSWALDTSNALRVASGSIRAPLLKLDTASAFFPISGKLTKLDLQVESQDLTLATGASVALASVKLSSNDLSISSDESYPVGSALLAGAIKSATFGNLDSVVTANASMSLSLSRKPAESLRVETGSIDATAQVKSSVGDVGSASVYLSNIQAYSSSLSAGFVVRLDSYQTSVVVPADYKADTSGGDLLKVETQVNLRQVPISAALAQPIIFDGKLVVAGGVANVAQIRDVPLIINLGIGAQELVYVNVNLKPAAGPSTNACNPKVSLNGGTYRVNGLSDFGVANGSVSLVLRDFALQSDISMKAEDRGCKYVAGAVCGVIGSIAGPAGAIAGAYLCTSEVDKAENAASGKINEAVRSAITAYKFTLGQ